MTDDWLSIYEKREQIMRSHIAFLASQVDHYEKRCRDLEDLLSDVEKTASPERSRHESSNQGRRDADARHGG